MRAYVTGRTEGRRREGINREVRRKPGQAPSTLCADLKIFKKKCCNKKSRCQFVYLALLFNTLNIYILCP